MSLMEQGAVGITPVALSGSAVTLTTANNASDQARYLVQQYTGVLSGVCTVTLPNVFRVGWAQNTTSGGFAVRLTCGGGTTFSVPDDGNFYFYYSDGGGNIVTPGIGFSAVQTTGGINAGGNLAVSGDAFVTGNTHLTASLTTGGDVALNGAGTALTVPNGLSLFNIIQTTGSTADSGLNGWNFDSTGANPVSGGSVPVAAVFNNAYALGAGFFASSDERLKREIVAITPNDGEDFVKTARPVSYVKHGTKEAGFLAQDQIRDGRGDLVIAVPHKGMPAFDEGGLRVAKDHALSLNYDNYIAYLTAALQGAIARIDALERARAVQ